MSKLHDSVGQGPEQSYAQASHRKAEEISEQEGVSLEPDTGKVVTEITKEIRLIVFFRICQKFEQRTKEILQLLVARLSGSTQTLD